jgi:hypothetical protein
MHALPALVLQRVRPTAIHARRSDRTMRDIALGWDP